jgi:fumarylacetoacetase
VNGAVPSAEDSAFPLESLPYGVFSPSGGSRRIGVAIGDFVLDVPGAAPALGLGGDDAELLSAPVLNRFMAAGPATWRRVRRLLVEALGDAGLRDTLAPHLHRRESVSLHLAFEVADYVDFYSSEHHASNVGRILRPGTDPLPPSWKHFPMGYHGRAGTVVVSGTPVRRPWGQELEAGGNAPRFGPSGRLDAEVEVGFVVGVGSEVGSPVEASSFADHVFAICLLNDWSARDIQALEYVPLGPFLGKSFATSVSPWLVPLDALEAARCAPPPRDTPLQPYLVEASPWGLDLALELECNGTVVSRPPFAGMYWTAPQQLAHLTVNGASLRTGDLYASGTVSGAAPSEWGSLLELSWNGTRPLRLGDGSERSFLEDGDVVTIRGTARGIAGRRISLGEVTGSILPARAGRSA